MAKTLLQSTSRLGCPLQEGLEKFYGIFAVVVHNAIEPNFGNSPEWISISSHPGGAKEAHRDKTKCKELLSLEILIGMRDASRRKG